MYDKNKLLQFMGITQWRLRDNHDHPFLHIALNNFSGKTIGLVLATITPDHSILVDEQEKTVRNIAKALTPHFTINSDQKNSSYAFVILLGHSAQKIFLKSDQPCDRIISSFSIIQLIQNPEYKKLLWIELKPLREFFHDKGF